MPDNTPKQIKIVLADDHQFFRASFKTTIQAHDHKQQIIFVGEAANGADLIDCVTMHQPDIVISDIKMPKVDGIEAARIIKYQFPAVRIIALSEMEDETTVLGMLQAGASGYLVKSATVEEIIDAINKVYNGEHYFSGAISNKVYRKFIEGGIPVGSNRGVQFSDLEITVIKLICQQLSEQKIADELAIEVTTVENTILHLLEKTKSTSTIGIALFALHHGIVKPGELNR